MSLGISSRRVADGQTRRDFRNRKSGRLRGERGTARHARIHLDHDHAPVGVNRELDVRPSGIDADFADDPQRRIPHHLVFLVGQGLRGRDRDRVAGMHAHRIEIFNRANDDDVVGAVAHHFELEFLPALDRFLDQHLMAGRHVEARTRPWRDIHRARARLSLRCRPACARAE